jgi:hypothetical protein
MEACLGVGPCRDWRERVAAHPVYRVNAVATRMLQQLFQGDIAAAERSEKQVERLRIETRQLYDASALSLEVVAHVISEDLTRVRQTLPQLEKLAERYEPWRAVREYAIAAFHRIRRDPSRALPVIEEAVGRTRAGEHLLWAQIATMHVGVLGDLGRHAEALVIAEQYVLQARNAELGYTAEPVWLALAVCQANAGHAAAMETAGASLGRTRALGVQGLYLGLAHEVLARVALQVEDEAAFELHAQLCYEAYGCYRNPALLAKHRRLQKDAERRKPQPSAALALEESVMTRSGVSVAQALAACRDTTERARVALDLLIGEAGADGGFLFTLGVDQAECIAAVGGLRLQPDLHARVSEYLLAQGRDAPTTSSESAESSGREWRDAEGGRYAPVLLSHELRAGCVVTGVALLAFSVGGEVAHSARVASAISRNWALGDAATLVYAGDA